MQSICKVCMKITPLIFETNNNTHQSKVNTCPRYYIDNVSKYKIHVHEFSNQEERRLCCEPFVPISKRVQSDLKTKYQQVRRHFVFLL